MAKKLSISVTAACCDAVVLPGESHSQASSMTLSKTAYTYKVQHRKSTPYKAKQHLKDVGSLPLEVAAAAYTSRLTGRHGLVGL
jgi:hypothetical protein